MTIIEQVLNLVRAACAVQEDNVTRDSKFSDLSIDSLSFVEFVTSAEDAFNISFNDDELILSDWKTVGDFICATKKKLREKKNEMHLKKHRTVR